MIKSLCAAGLATAALAGCVAVSDVDSGADLEEINALAIQTCGGPGEVQEVNEDGFKCKDDAY